MFKKQTKPPLNSIFDKQLKIKSGSLINFIQYWPVQFDRNFQKSFCVHCVMTLRQQRQFWSCKKAGPIPSLVCTLRSFELANRTNRGNSLLLPLVSFGIYSFYLWRGLKNNSDFSIRSNIKMGFCLNHQLQYLTEGFWSNLLEVNFWRVLD